jgi:hypothetical protein
MTGLRISKTLTLPIEAATWTFAVLSIKGWGKTYVSADFAEELVKNEIPIVVLDGMGIWWGLTVGVKENKGLPVVVFGGQHKDLDLPLKQLDRIRQTLDEDKMRIMVKAILDARISVVLDTSGLSKGLQRRIVATFVNELTRLNAAYGARHVFIEEADLWCPQRGMFGDVALSAGAIDDLVRRGGNYNLGCTMITQRSAVLNKDVLTQASCLIVGRILHKIDKDAVKTWVQSMGDPKDPKIIKWYDTLRELKNGEGYVWHPEDPVIFRKVMFRERETLHATREYFRQVKTTEIKPLDRTAFIDRYKKIVAPKPKPTDRTIAQDAARAPFLVGPLTIPLREQIANILPGEILNGKGHQGLLGQSGKVLRFTPPDIPEPPTEQPRPITDGYIAPEWVVQKWTPTFKLAVDMFQNPPSALVRVLVVLANSDMKSTRDDKWTVRKIKDLVRAHAWPDEGVTEAIDQLLRTETLAWKSGYLRFAREKVRVRETDQPIAFAQGAT